MPKNIGKWKIAFLALLIAGSVYVVLSEEKPKSYVTDEGIVFGTTYHITYSRGNSVKSDIEACLARVDASLSVFNEHSIVSAVNNNRPVKADTMFCDVYGLARQVSEQTGGAFDITVAPLVNAWGFGFEKRADISPQTIDSLRTFVGFRKVRLDASRRVVKTDPRVMLDCSAIAKGYGCDVVARLLDSLETDNYMIEIGGEVVVKGVNPHSKPWNIGISRPVEDSTLADNGIRAILGITDCAVATSGNYRRFYYKDGRRVAHTIDPRTGYPAAHTLLSATVVAKDCATADAFATAFMVLGLDSARAVLSSRKDLQALFIYSADSSQNRIWVSPQLEKNLKTK